MHTPPRLEDSERHPPKLRPIWLAVVALVAFASAPARAQTSTRPVDVVAALAELRSASDALPSALRTARLVDAVTWLANRPTTPSFRAADVSDEYTVSLRRAAAMLRQTPGPDIMEDITADLEAKVAHCRKVGVGMGGQVSLKVNTVRTGTAVSNWHVRALLKFYERLAGVEPRLFLRASSPTEMALEPGRYWVWAIDPATGKVSDRVLVPVTGQKELVLDLPVP
jgi:hypothetical protein